MTETVNWPVIILFHGSRHEEAIKSSAELTKLVSKELDEREVKAAYLSIGQPNLPDLVGELARAGAKNISLLPAFLFKGVHYNKDLNSAVLQIKSDYPNLNIILTEPIGACMEVADILLKRLRYSEKTTKPRGG